MKAWFRGIEKGWWRLAFQEMWIGMEQFAF